jgi:hypothetical protein
MPAESPLPGDIGMSETGDHAEVDLLAARSRRGKVYRVRQVRSLLPYGRHRDERRITVLYAKKRDGKETIRMKGQLRPFSSGGGQTR